MTNKRAAGGALGLAAALCASTISASPAQAQGGGGGGGVRSAGTCSGGGVWHLKAKADDGRIEVEFEVDTNHAGQKFAVRITDNGHQVLNRYATTAAPSGSFSVQPRITNRAGVDVIHAHAVRGSRDCAGTVRF